MVLDVLGESESGEPDLSERLASVPWGTLSHNYGAADDVPGLVRQLIDPHGSDKAMHELDNVIYHQGGWVCSAAPALAPILLRLVCDPAVPCRTQLVRLLGSLEEVAATAEARFIDQGWRAAWTEALPVLLAVLDDPDPAVRCSAADAVASSTTDADAVADALQRRWAIEPDRRVRLDIMLAIGTLCRATRDAAVLAWLRDAVAGAGVQDRMAAVIAGQRINPGAEIPAEDLDAVVFALDAEDVTVWHEPLRDRFPHRSTIIWAARELSHPQAQARVAADLLRHTETARRRDAVTVAADVLQRWRSPAQTLVPLLVQRLDDRDVPVRALATHILASIGEPAAPYVDRFAGLLADDAPLAALPAGVAPLDDQARSTIGDVAVWGLVNLGDPRCVPALRDRLTGPRLGFGTAGRFELSWYSVDLPRIHEVLHRVPQYVDQLLPAVLHCLRTTPDRELRRALVEALAGWGPRAAPAVLDLAAVLETDLAGPAAEALGAVGPAAASTAGRLWDLARDQDHEPRTRWLAAVAHARVSGDPTLVLALLPEEMRTTTWSQARACRAMAELGPAAAAHLPVLRELLSDRPGMLIDREDWLRAEAAHALTRIQGDPGGAIEVLSEVVSRLTERTAVPVTRAAARYLAELGPAADPLADVLRRILASDQRLAHRGGWRAFAEDTELRRHLTTALNGPPAAGDGAGG